MKWSDIPFSIEVRRIKVDDSKWKCVGRLHSRPLADIAAAHLWRLVYSKREDCELRIIEADRNSRKILKAYP